MSRNVFSDMVAYYSNLAAQLTSEAKQAGILTNPSAIGTDKEEIYRRFLKRHVPYACEVFRGGYLFDIEGNTSKQVDLIVTSGVTPRFEMREGSQAIAPVEGAIAAIEVKSMLDKAKLYEALRNIAEIPRIIEPNKAISPIMAMKSGTWWWEWPFKVVFAFNAIDARTLQGHLQQFYRENADIPYECRPSMIHALGSSVIFRMSYDVEDMDAERQFQHQNSEPRYEMLDVKADVCAMAVLFSALQKNAFLSNHMIWRYSKWLVRIADELLRES